MTTRNQYLSCTVNPWLVVKVAGSSLWGSDCYWSHCPIIMFPGLLMDNKVRHDHNVLYARFISLLHVELSNTVGVSLKFRGVIIPNNSFVDIDEIMYTAPSLCCNDLPSNTNSRDEALLCVTDLVDCCDSPHTVRGDWYYPDGRRVELNPSASVMFRANRGPNQIIGQTQFYGSVRLFRRYSTPSERGRFYCKLPSAADPNTNQTLLVNIGEFDTGFAYIDNVYNIMIAHIF